MSMTKDSHTRRHASNLVCILAFVYIFCLSILEKRNLNIGLESEQHHASNEADR
jgi:hypothetical protein